MMKEWQKNVHGDGSGSVHDQKAHYRNMKATSRTGETGKERVNNDRRKQLDFIKIENRRCTTGRGRRSGTMITEMIREKKKRGKVIIVLIAYSSTSQTVCVRLRTQPGRRGAHKICLRQMPTRRPSSGSRARTRAGSR